MFEISGRTHFPLRVRSHVVRKQNAQVDALRWHIKRLIMQAIQICFLPEFDKTQIRKKSHQSSGVRSFQRTQTMYYFVKIP